MAEHEIDIRPRRVLSKDEVLARKVYGETEFVDFGDGTGVVVRGLTRGEAGRLNKADDDMHAERLSMCWGIVEPAMTLSEIEGWYEQGRSGDIQKIMDTMQRLSGSAPGQAKEYTKSVP